MDICVRDASPKGRGVFAQRRFAEGETIERCPVIVLPDPEWELLEETTLRDYYFYWDEDAVAIAAGCGMLYNHSETPNAQAITLPEERAMEFVALQAIDVDEEITIRYRCPPWFEVAE